MGKFKQIFMKLAYQFQLEVIMIGKLEYIFSFQEYEFLVSFSQRPHKIVETPISNLLNLLVVVKWLYTMPLLDHVVITKKYCHLIG